METEVKTLITIIRANAVTTYRDIKQKIIKTLGTMFLEQDADDEVENALVFNREISDKERQILTNMCKEMSVDSESIYLIFIDIAPGIQISNDNYISAYTDER